MFKVAWYDVVPHVFPPRREAIFNIPVTASSSPLPATRKNQGELSRHLSRGETPIVVAVKGRAVGLLFSADAMRPAAATAVTDLARRGLNVRLASGDRKEAVLAAAVAAGVPTDNTSWGLTPGKVSCTCLEYVTMACHAQCLLVFLVGVVGQVFSILR